jgi:hypothetical protein
MADWDEVLGDLDRPRALPPGLRDRLERRLTSDDVATTLACLDAPLVLSPALRQRLEGALVRPRRTGVAGWGAAAAAVVGIVAATALLTQGGSSPPTTTAGPGRGLPSDGPTAGDGVAQPGSVTGAVGSAGGSPAAVVPQPAAQGPASRPTPRAQADQGALPAAAGPLAPSPAQAAPQITDLQPRSGPFTGGTVVTVRGRGFTADARVLFDGTASSRVVVVSATELRATAPAHLPGAVDVVVSTAAGSSAPARYTYLAS